MEAETQAKVWAAATGYEVAEGSYWLPDDEDDEFRAIPDLTTGDGMLRLLDAMQVKYAYNLGSRLDGGAWARIRLRHTAQDWNYAEAPKPPLAVARAAASALGVEEGRA
jgi:hypothetical protein